MILKGSPSKYLLVPLLTLTVAYFLVFNHYLPGMDTNGILSAKITKDPFDPLELSGFCSCNNRSVASASERTQKKVVVYSLFGDPTNRNIRQRYYQQLEKRIQEIALRLPEWGIRVYHNVSANNYICSLACKYHGLIQFYNVSHPQYETERRINPRLWRFLPLLDGSVEMMLSRDLDSNVSEREVAAVREWMNSNLSFHIMRDHPQHGVFILAGMWGAKLAEHPQLVRNLGKIMLVMGKAQDKEADQRFLWVYVWPITQFDTMTHDSYFCERWEFTLFGWRPSLPFPTKREGFDFVGSLHLEDELMKPPNSTEGLNVCPLACRPSYGKDWNYC